MRRHRIGRYVFSVRVLSFLAEFFRFNKCEAFQGCFCGEADLMSRIFEFCQYPELFSCDDSCNEIFDVVVDLVVGHCSDHDVVIVRDAFSAVYDEVEPLV